MDRFCRYAVAVAYFGMLFCTSEYIAKVWGTLAQLCFIPVCAVLGLTFGIVFANAKEGESE